MALQSTSCDDPQLPSTSTDSTCSTRVEDNLRRFNSKFPERKRIPTTLWSYCTSKQRGKCLKTYKKASVNVRTLNFQEILYASQDYLKYLAKASCTTFEELCKNLRFMAYFNKVPTSKSADAADFLRLVANCVILNGDAWEAKIDNSTIYDWTTAQMFADTNGDEQMNRWRDRLRLEMEELKLKWEIEPPESPFIASRDEHLRKSLRLYEELHAKDAQFIATCEKALRSIAKNNMRTSTKESGSADIDYYVYNADKLLSGALIAFDLPNLAKLPEFTYPTFENDGYFPASVTNKGVYLLDRYKEAHAQCHPIFVKAYTKAAQYKIPDGFEESSFQTHELLYYHSIGRHLHGFFEVIVETEHGWTSARGTRVRRRYMVEMYQRTKFPLYVRFEEWPAGLRWAFDKVYAYGIKIMHVLHHWEFHMKDASKDNEQKAVPDVTPPEEVKAKRKRRSRKDPLAEGEANRPVIRARKPIQAPRLPPGNTRKSQVSKETASSAHDTLLPYSKANPQPTLPTVSPRRKSGTAKRRYEESMAISSSPPAPPVTYPAPIVPPVVTVPPVPVKKKKKDSWDEHESTFLEEHVDDGTGYEDPLLDGLMGHSMERNDGGVWVPQDRGGLIAPEQYAKEILEHYGVKKGDDDSGPSASTSAGAFSIPPGPLADLVADISDEFSPSNNSSSTIVPYHKPTRRPRKTAATKLSTTPTQQPTSSKSTISVGSAVLAEVLALTSSSTTHLSASSVQASSAREDVHTMPSKSSAASSFSTPLPSASGPLIQKTPTSSASSVTSPASNGHTHSNGPKPLAPVKRAYMNKPPTLMNSMNSGAKPVFPVKKLSPNPLLMGSPVVAPKMMMLNQQRPLPDGVKKMEQYASTLRKVPNGKTDAMKTPVRTARPNIRPSTSDSLPGDSKRLCILPGGRPSVEQIAKETGPQTPEDIAHVASQETLRRSFEERGLLEGAYRARNPNIEVPEAATKPQQQGGQKELPDSSTCRRQFQYLAHMDDPTVYNKKREEPGYPNGKYHKIWDSVTKTRCLMPPSYKPASEPKSSAPPSSATSAPSPPPSSPLTDPSSSSASSSAPKIGQRLISNTAPQHETSPVVRPRSLSNQMQSTQNGFTQRSSPAGASSSSAVAPNTRTTPTGSFPAAPRASPQLNVPQAHQRVYPNYANGALTSPESASAPRTTTTTAYTYIETQQALVPNPWLGSLIESLNRKNQLSSEERFQSADVEPTIRDVLMNLKKPQLDKL